MPDIKCEVSDQSITYTHRGLPMHKTVTVKYSKAFSEWVADIPPVTNLSASAMHCLAELIQEAERMMKILEAPHA